jgi:hypothetical protein
MKYLILSSMILSSLSITGCFVSEDPAQTEEAKEEYGAAIGTVPLYTARVDWFLGPIKTASRYTASCPQGPLGMCSKSKLVREREYGFHGGKTRDVVYDSFSNSENGNKEVIQTMTYSWNSEAKLTQFQSICTPKENCAAVNQFDSKSTVNYLNSNSIIFDQDSSQTTYTKLSSNEWKIQTNSWTDLWTYHSLGFWWGMKMSNSDGSPIGSVHYQMSQSSDGKIATISGSNWISNSHTWDGKVGFILHYLDVDNHGNPTRSMEILLSQDDDGKPTSDTTYFISEYTYWK